MDLTELSRQKAGPDHRHPWELARARICGFLIRELATAKHILDIGSGDAFVLQFLQQKKFAEQYTAVDIAYTDEIIQRLHQGGAHNIQFKNKPDDPGKNDCAADIVLLMDVLEHCDDDSQVLIDATQNPMTAPGARFVVTVPAGKRLFSGHDALLGHYRRYSRKQLVLLCKDSGLVVIRSGYFFFSLLPFRAITKLLEKTGLRKTNRSVENWTKGKPLTNFISLILWLDFRLCHTLSSAGINIPGLSCYCVCQKPLQ